MALTLRDISRAVYAAVYESGSWVAHEPILLDPVLLKLAGYADDQWWTPEDWRTLLAVLRLDYGVDLDLAILAGIEEHPQGPRIFQPRTTAADNPYAFQVSYREKQRPERIEISVVSARQPART